MHVYIIVHTCGLTRSRYVCMYIYTFIHILRSAGGTYWLPHWILRAVSAAAGTSEDSGYARA